MQYLDMWSFKVTCVAVAALLGQGLSLQSYTPEFQNQQTILGGMPSSHDAISQATRAYWVRQANLALNHPCPFAAFGSVIVNHTGNSGLGQLVCTGANSMSMTGNPTLHGTYAWPSPAPYLAFPLYKDVD